MTTVRKLPTLLFSFLVLGSAPAGCDTDELKSYDEPDVFRAGLGTLDSIITDTKVKESVNRKFIDYAWSTSVETGNVETAATIKTGGQVKIQVNEDWYNDAANADEVRDTLIFEGINAANFFRLTQATSHFETSDQTLSSYGRAYSDVETEATWYTAEILEAIKGEGIAVSEWGTKHIDAVNDHGGTLESLQEHFATTAHDPAADDERSMPSAQLYAYDWVVKASALKVEKKLKLHWIKGQYDKLTDTQKTCGLKLSALTNFASNSATKGRRVRAEKYNEMLETVANHQVFGNNKPTFLTGAEYQSPLP